MIKGRSVDEFAETLGISHFECKHDNCKWLKPGLCCQCRYENIMVYQGNSSLPDHLMNKLNKPFPCKKEEPVNQPQEKYLKSLLDMPKAQGLYNLVFHETGALFLGRFLMGNWSIMGKYGRWKQLAADEEVHYEWIEEAQ